MAKRKSVEEMYEILTIQGDASVPYRDRIAVTLRERLKEYFRLIEEADERLREPKATAFFSAFYMDGRYRLLSATVNAIADGAYGVTRQKEITFKEVLPALYESVQINDAGQKMTNVDANNAFNAWYGSKKPPLMKGVGFVRFAGFIWHLFWDPKFQEWCKKISTL